MRDSVKVIIILSLSFLLVTLEHVLTGIVGFSGLFAVMSNGNSIAERKKGSCGEAVRKIFQTVGGGRTSPVCPGRSGSGYPYAFKAGAAAAAVILGVLVFRMLGVLICLLGTELNRKEKLFCMFAYMPKATVQ